jgi:hypothetical protein
MLLAVYVPNTAELPTQNGARSPLRNRSLLLEFDPADHSGTPKMFHFYVFFQLKKLIKIG